MIALAMSDGDSNGRIPGYQLRGKLWNEAKATVFKALQISRDRIVAIRVLPKSLSQNRNFIERFVADAKAASRVQHDNIVQTIDVGRTPDGFSYQVMEYVEGRTLVDLMIPPPLGEGKIFSESDGLDICIQIANALAFAHQRGLIHRNVKPRNILLTDLGVAKLTDLGFARLIYDKDFALTAEGTAFGTPYYISPEQIRGEENIDARADIYSLGATMYHMMTGRPAFGGETASAVLQQHLSVQLIPANCVNKTMTQGVSRIIDVAMAKSKEDRFQSIAFMLKAMKAGRTRI